MKVDFHCHTRYSPDSIADLEAVLAAAHTRGLDRLVITDHNSIRGAVMAHTLEPDFVIVGEEIQTTCGELLAAFVKEEVPANLEPLKAMELLKAQNAFISVSHPMDYMRSGWPDADLEELLPFIDAIEGGNARVRKQGTNVLALEFAGKHGLAVTAGSDAHHPSEIGRMALELPEFHDADGLRRVIAQGEIVGKHSKGWVHFFSSQARLVKRLNKSRFAD